MNSSSAETKYNKAEDGDRGSKPPSAALGRHKTSAGLDAGERKDSANAATHHQRLRPSKNDQATELREDVNACHQAKETGLYSVEVGKP